MQRIVIFGLDEIAEQLGCSKKTLYKWIREKEFPAFKMDGVWRAMPTDITEWLREQKRSAARSAHPPDTKTRSCDFGERRAIGR